MDINASSVIDYPIAEVYRVYRDELAQIAPYVGNVKAINVLSREVRPGFVKLHNEWVGRGEIPKVAQGIVKPEMLAWDDYAEWDDVATLVRWTIKTRAFTEKIRCVGQSRLTADGPDRTRVTLTGILELTLTDIPGIPRFLAPSLTPQVEKLFVTLIKPNLEQVNTAIGKYLDARRTSS